MISVCVCTGGEVSWCHQRRRTILALSVFPSTRAIIASVTSSQPIPFLESQLSDSEYSILQSVGNVCHQNGIQYICTAAVPGWLVTHHSWKAKAWQVSCVPALCHWYCNMFSHLDSSFLSPLVPLAKCTRSSGLLSLGWCCFAESLWQWITPHGFTKHWIEFAPVYIFCSLNCIKIFLNFLCKVCVVYISVLYMHRLSITTGHLKSWDYLPKTSAGIEYVRPPKACFRHRHCTHFFAVVSVIHQSITLAKQPLALWSSFENHLVSFTCKFEDRFMWVQLSGLETIWSQSRKHT